MKQPRASSGHLAVIEEDIGGMELDLSEGSSSSTSFSRCSSCSSSLQRSPSSRSMSSDSGSVDMSDKERLQFNPEEYLQMHKKALHERARHGSSGPKMKLLYRYWCDFLQDNFNDAMYLSFLKLAQEDAAHGHIFGLRHLFKFFKKRLTCSFDADHFSEFELLAHRFHDYLDYDYGLRCLLELLTMGTDQKAAAAGCPLNPLTVALLEAWRQYVEACAGSAAQMGARCGGTPGGASPDPRVKLHQQLAEKRKRRSKTRRAGETSPEQQQQQQVAAAAMAPGCRELDVHARLRSQERVDKAVAAQQRQLACMYKSKAVLRAKARPWLPQAQVRLSSHPEAHRLPDRLGELLGN